jgi:L-threonylcarbamoyladenylate synthase
LERILLSDSNVKEVAARAAAVLRAGGVVLYPTDTLYGLGADALSDDAVGKIFAVKGRDEGKPMHAIVSDIEMAAIYGDMTDVVRPLASNLPPGQITFVVTKKQGMNSGISKDISTFGFRIPDDTFCLEMLRAFRGPITATSANSAGMVPQRNVGAILEQIGETGIDLVVDGGELPPRKPSSVVNVAGGKVTVLREGAVSRAQIEAVTSAH